MPAPYELATDQIATDLIARVPTFDTSVAYSRAEGEDENEGESGYRTFWFDWFGAETQGTTGRTGGSLYRRKAHRFDIVIRLLAGASTVRQMPNRIAEESSAIEDLINRREVWPTGVRTVRADNSRVDYSGKDPVLRVECTAFTAETS